ncbi:MAG: orotate phosphoribosyltransferase [Burkholderiales bacterium]|nr:orotate phosphoribosyltransferase [Phycisphaerae bacterium]
MATQLKDRSAQAGGNAVKSRAWSAEELQLRDLLAARTFKRGDFTLASGRKSRIYFNVKTTMMHPQGAALCGRLLLAQLKGLNANYIGGLEMGAVPLLSVVSAFSAEDGSPLPSFFVRKQPKPHGTQLLIEGMDDLGGETLRGQHVVLIDDVATSGGSILKAVDQVEAAGGTMTDAIVILDREEGASEKLGARGITLHSLFTATDLGVTEADRALLD